MHSAQLYWFKNSGIFDPCKKKKNGRKIETWRILNCQFNFIKKNKQTKSTTLKSIKLKKNFEMFDLH